MVLLSSIHSTECVLLGYLGELFYYIDHLELTDTMAVIDLYEPVSDSILKPDLVSWYK